MKFPKSRWNSNSGKDTRYLKIKLSTEQNLVEEIKPAIFEPTQLEQKKIRSHKKSIFFLLSLCLLKVAGFIFSW